MYRRTMPQVTNAFGARVLLMTEMIAYMFDERRMRCPRKDPHAHAGIHTAASLRYGKSGEGDIAGMSATGAVSRGEPQRCVSEGVRARDHVRVTGNRIRD